MTEDEYKQKYEEFLTTLKPYAGDYLLDGFLSNDGEFISTVDLEGAFQDWCLKNPISILEKPE